MQRHLHALGHESNQHQMAKIPPVNAVRNRGVGPQGAAGAVIENQDRGQQAIAGDVRHQQNFARAVDGFAVGVPEAHQRERAEADHFPAEIKDEEVRAIYQGDEPADEDEHRGVEARGRLVVRHVANRVEKHQAPDAGSHEGEEHTQRVDVQHHGERPVPRQRLQVDTRAAANQRGDTDDSEDGRQTGEKGEDSFSPGGEEARHQNLQRCAEQEGTWSNQNEGRRVHAFMLSVRPLEVM